MRGNKKIGNETKGTEKGMRRTLMREITTKGRKQGAEARGRQGIGDRELRWKVDEKRERT